jgi:hypothetical protein
MEKYTSKNTTRLLGVININNFGTIANNLEKIKMDMEI